MSKVLFIGTFLSKTRGTKSITETLAEKLSEDAVKIKLSSCYENKIMRLIDIVFQLLIFKGDKIHVDVFSGQAFNIASIATIIASWRKKKILLTLHGGKLAEFDTANPNRINKVFSRVQYIQTPSLFLKDYFEKKRYAIHYLPNSIDLAKFPYKEIDQQRAGLLWVRAFTSIYNPDLAIKILFEVQKKYPGCTLTMIGPDNGLLNDTIQLVKNFGMTNSVFFKGAIPNDELYHYYQSHSIYLNTTSYESFGVAVVEAAACGIPIVSTKVGEIPYLWEHGKNILMAEDFSAKSFSEQIFNLWEHQELAVEISRAARIKAASFGWEKIKPFWLGLLKNEEK